MERNQNLKLDFIIDARFAVDQEVLLENLVFVGFVLENLRIRGNSLGLKKLVGKKL